MGIVYEVMYKRVYLKPTPGRFETDTCKFETDARHFLLNATPKINHDDWYGHFIIKIRYFYQIMPEIMDK